MTITIRDVYTGGEIIEDTPTYFRMRNKKEPYMYDYNFTYLYTFPTLERFKELEEIEEEQRIKDGLQHVKYKIKATHALTVNFKWYLEINDYHYGTCELYQIQPENFNGVGNDEVTIRRAVRASSDEPFLELTYNEGIQYGEDFAKKKKNSYRNRMQDQQSYFLVAYLDGVPCGIVTLIEREKTVEIDALVVIAEYRKKKVAETLQRYAMDNFNGKTVILVADAEDTPREMYQKQGYELVEKWHEIQIVSEE